MGMLLRRANFVLRKINGTFIVVQKGSVVQACHSYLAHALRAHLGLCGHVLPLLVSDLLVHSVEELSQPGAGLFDPEAANLSRR